jgi:cathepsin L
MKLLILSIVLVCAISFIEGKHSKKCTDVEGWKNYKKKYEIEFFDDTLDTDSCINYEINKQKLEMKKKQRSGNSDDFGETSVLHMNHSSTDYKGLKIDFNELKQRKLVFNFKPTMKTEDLPQEFSWVSLGFNLPAKNQGSCGSCYSFAATGAFEGQYFKCNNKVVSLSEQYFLDCSPKTGGCNGGDPMRVADFGCDNGIPLDSQYEYKKRFCTGEADLISPKTKECASPNTCPLNRAHENFKADTVEYIKPNDEIELLKAIIEAGPTMIVVNADDDFSYFRGDVFKGINTDSTTINHAVLAVGWDKDSIHIKNSWGTSWGKNGYIRVARNSPNKEGTAGKYNKIRFQYC